MKELECRIDNMCTMLYQLRIQEGCEEVREIIPLLVTQIDRINDADCQSEILGYLQQALTAMEQEDWTLLADIFLYEILDRIKE